MGVVGTYAGSLVPTVDPDTGLTDPNSLAVFTLRIPQIGLANGTAAIFRNGFYYPGTIQASADPLTAQISGGIQGQFDDVVFSSTTITEARHYFATGRFEGAKIVAKSGTFSILAVRIKGAASISYVPGSGFIPDPRGDSGGPIPYKILGFKQSFNTN